MSLVRSYIRIVTSIISFRNECCCDFISLKFIFSFMSLGIAALRPRQKAQIIEVRRGGATSLNIYYGSTKMI